MNSQSNTFLLFLYYVNYVCDNDRIGTSSFILQNIKSLHSSKYTLNKTAYLIYKLRKPLLNNSNLKIFF